MAGYFPVISMVGPRQSGKTTVVRKVFGDYAYINLENIQNRQFAVEDPQGFLKEYPEKVIIDEAQYAPQLFSYIQENVDESKVKGKFILTGSQNFLMSQHISQSLAGRTAFLSLHPLSYEELKGTGFISLSLEEFLFKGFYPGLYDQDLDPVYWYPSYINTYIERDVRNIKNIENIHDFQGFLKICASRIGQIVNYSSLAADVGVSHPTIKSWLSILESSHIIKLLPPFYKNFSKRVIKSPKLYFMDTGLVCSLLGINHKEQIKGHFLKGPLFENFVIAELIKERTNKFQPDNLFYWRDNVGNEIDCIQEEGGFLHITEIKSGSTIRPDFFRTFKYFEEIATDLPLKFRLIYGGEKNQERTQYRVLGWRNMFRD